MFSTMLLVGRGKLEFRCMFSGDPCFAIFSDDTIQRFAIFECEIIDEHFRFLRVLPLIVFEKLLVRRQQDEIRKARK